MFCEIILNRSVRTLDCLPDKINELITRFFFGNPLIMALINRQKAVHEILELFETQLNMLVRLDKLEKMDIRKKIRDAVMLVVGMDIRQPGIFMNMIEDKLQDVIRLFQDELGFKRKLAQKIEEQFKITY